MSPSHDGEHALAAYNKTPPRNINIDPKSARTVVHETRAHHRGPPVRDSSQDSFQLRVPQWANDDDTDRKSGILPARGIAPQRRGNAADGGRPRRPRSNTSDSDSDSDSNDYLKPRRTSRRRQTPRSHSSHDTRSSSYRPTSNRRYSNELTRYDDRRELAPVAKARSRSSNNDVDSDSEYDSEAHEREKQQARNKKLLYTGLATITTVAAANGIYQNTKGFHGRHNAYKEAAANGELEDEAERKKRIKKRLAMDAFGLLVVGVGMNNVRLGWQRREEKRKAHEEAEKKHWDKMERAASGGGRERSRAYSVEER